MSNLLINSIKPKGLYYNGKKYGSPVANPTINHVLYAKYAQKTIPEAGAEQTSGYLRTFTISSNQFRIYLSNDLFTPLSYLPNYRFIYQNITEKELSGLNLIYDGDNLFHIEGTINITDSYETSKLGVGNPGCLIGLVDENGNYFLSDTSGNITSSISSSATTVNYVSSTITIKYSQIDEIKSEIVSVPYDLSQKYTIPSDVSLPLRYIISSMSSDTSTIEASHYLG